MATKPDARRPSQPEQRRFLSGLQPFDAPPPNSVAVGQGWLASLAPDPRERTRRRKRNLEIIIEAESEGIAQRARDLMVAMHQGLRGEPSEIDEVLVWEVGRPSPEEHTCDFVTAMGSTLSGAIMTHHLWLACELAAAASFDRDIEYATHQIRQSMVLHANFAVDLDPGVWPYEQRSSRPKDHVRFGAAIITAYAAIEQLGLAVGGGPKKPAFDNGKWDQEILADLNRRLSEAGIDPESTVLWEARGTPSSIPLKAAESHNAAPWSDHIEIRDGFLRIADAIAQVRFLRNNVAAHKVRDAVADLSVHDVSNCQLVARRLLFGRLGVWPFNSGDTSHAIEGD